VCISTLLQVTGIKENPAKTAEEKRFLFLFCRYVSVILYARFRRPHMGYFRWLQ
jgi:hypothetical protein